MLSILLIIAIFVSTTIANVNAHPSTHPPADRNQNLRSGREVLLQTAADTHVSTKGAPTGPPCFELEQPYDAEAMNEQDDRQSDGTFSSVS